MGASIALVYAPAGQFADARLVLSIQACLAGTPRRSGRALRRSQGPTPLLSLIRGDLHDTDAPDHLVKRSHELEGWLAARGPALEKAGITAVAGRAPVFAGRPSATWISFEAAASNGRLVLWSSGRCQLAAAAGNGTQLCDSERTVTTPGELDDALVMLTGHLAPPGH
jgi:hypothetical protein